MHRVTHRVTPRYGVSRESLLRSTEERCEGRTPEGRSPELSQLQIARQQPQPQQPQLQQPQQQQQHGPVRSPIAVRATCGQELCEGGFDVEIHISF
eukprot:scaffold46000_cov61-Phaeocystis_antarctica.AAC.1